MSKQEWTKEPWKVFTATSKPDVMVGIGEDSSGDAITPALWGTDEEAMANARRIVDCVNALTSINNPEEYISSLREENERLRELLGEAEEALMLTYDVCDYPGKSSDAFKMAEKIRQALTKEG